MSRETIKAAAQRCGIGAQFIYTVLRRLLAANAYFSEIHLQAEVRLSQSDARMYRGSQAGIGPIQEARRQTTRFIRCPDL